MPSPPGPRRRRGRACGRSRRGRRRRASGSPPRPARARRSAFSSAGVPSRTIRPSSMIARRSQSWSASSRYCVVRKTVVPRALMRRTSSQTVSRLAGSRPGGRLVEEQDLGLVDERRREVQAALHPAGVALDAAVGGVLELDEREQLLARARRACARRARTAGPAGRAARARSGAGRGPASCSATPILLARAVGVAGDVDAGDARAAGGDRQQRGEHPHGRRLAGAVGPEEAEDLAGVDVEVDAAHRLDVPSRPL